MTSGLDGAQQILLTTSPWAVEQVLMSSLIREECPHSELCALLLGSEPGRSLPWVLLMMLVIAGYSESLLLDTWSLSKLTCHLVCSSVSTAEGFI